MQKIVISLTSYPARINMTYKVIESLFRQKEKADEIVLWLSILEFPNKYNDLPRSLNHLIGKNGFRIEWVNENIKSHKKYFYALQNKENIIITVDDDMYYSNTMVETLMNAYRKHPHAICARNVHIIMKDKDKILPYMMWDGTATEYIGLERMDLCAIGVNGILYPPECSGESWFNIKAIMKYAENQDDLWLKFNQIIDGIPVVYTGITDKDQAIENSQINPLYFQNAYGGCNDAAVDRLTEKLKYSHGMVYKKWFEGLMRMDEHLSTKRKFYNYQLVRIIEKCKEKDIYICGAGKYAQVLYNFIESCNKEQYITSFLVSRSMQDLVEGNKANVKLIKDLGKQDIFAVICGVGEGYRKEFREALKLYEFHEWIDMDLLGIEKLLQLEQIAGGG